MGVGQKPHPDYDMADWVLGKPQGEDRKAVDDAVKRAAQAVECYIKEGPQAAMDLIDCNGRLALTVACSGFDAQVADDVHTYGKLPLLGGQGSYIVSLAVNFFSKSYSRRWTVALDGERVSGEFILAAVCNGRYYGGGFMPVAEAKMDDGVLNTLVVRGVSRATFLRLVGKYAKGAVQAVPGADSGLPRPEGRLLGGGTHHRGGGRGGHAGHRLYRPAVGEEGELLLPRRGRLSGLQRR